MSPTGSEAAAMASEELVLTRVLDAPLALAYRVWTDHGHLARWWGPKGIGLTVIRLDFRPGGEFLYAMHGLGPEVAYGKFAYTEIVPEVRIVWNNSFATADGQVARNPFGGTWATYPLEVRHVLTFEADGDRTRVTLRARPIDATAEELQTFASVLGSVEAGTRGTLDQLVAYLDTLETDRDLVTARVFDAPRDLVFEAWTDPRHVDRWMGPRGFTTTTSEMDFRVGGSWRYVMRHEQYGSFENVVTYREIVRPERLVYDHGSPEDPTMMLVTVRFAEEGDGRTRLTMRSRFPSAEARDKVVAEVGAVEGGRQTLDRLAEHLASIGTRQERSAPCTG
ncbi:MAG: SRPBCC domain-containing protein [Candidatus Sericytochromatia bacterium]|nr:SRPBCC domain-containing protein [Candidatus Tanganyikabacteria bacterium]